MPRHTPRTALLAGLLFWLGPAPGFAQDPAPRPVDVSAGAGGFTLRSADGRWRLRVGGYFQADQRWYFRDAAEAGIDGFIIRRARPIVEGTVSQYFDFRIMPDFGAGQPTIYEAYVEARLTRAFALRAGKYKPPVGLERLQSATDLRFIERGFPTNIAPNRDVGWQVSGEIARGKVTYAGGVFNGVVDLGFGDVDASDAKELAGRLFILPLAKGPNGNGAGPELGLGVSGTIGNERGTLITPATSALRTPGQLTAFRYRANGSAAGTVVVDGRRSRVSPQGYAFYGPIGLLGEYITSSHQLRRDTVTAELSHYAWQVALSGFLTGERASYRSVSPRRPFAPGTGGFGAVELAIRVQGTGVEGDAFPVFADPAVSARRIRAWSAGVNWHLARNIKLMADYERAVFRGGAATGDRAPEHFFATRFQTAF